MKAPKYRDAIDWIAAAPGGPRTAKGLAFTQLAAFVADLFEVPQGTVGLDIFEERRARRLQARTPEARRQASRIRRELSAKPKRAHA
jgi:hypothetical protein